MFIFLPTAIDFPYWDWQSLISLCAQTNCVRDTSARNRNFGTKHNFYFRTTNLSLKIESPLTLGLCQADHRDDIVIIKRNICNNTWELSPKRRGRRSTTHNRFPDVCVIRIALTSYGQLTLRNGWSMITGGNTSCGFKPVMHTHRFTCNSALWNDNQ